MTTPAILAKLNVKTVQFDVGVGGSAALTQTDIAAALSMANLTRSAYLLARAKYCGDASVVSELESLIWGYLVDQSISQRWVMRDGGPGYLRRMAILACAESIDHGKCRKCKGRGIIYGRGVEIMPDDKPYKCPRCEGSGTGKQLSGRAKARFFGMDESTYRNYWSSRYIELLDEISVWESSVWTQIKKQFDSA